VAAHQDEARVQVAGGRQDLLHRLARADVEGDLPAAVLRDQASQTSRSRRRPRRPRSAPTRRGGSGGEGQAPRAARARRRRWPESGARGRAEPAPESARLRMRSGSGPPGFVAQ
jgi:hypothetical protein